jgi:hypothetical protein
MKTNAKKTRTNIENLKDTQGPAVDQEMSTNELRLVTGGLMRDGEVSSCTMNCDVDCD